LQGPPGRDAARIIDWQIDRKAYTAAPLMSDGSTGPALELRGLFEKFAEDVNS
jgi:hypothetical protein